MRSRLASQRTSGSVPAAKRCLKHQPSAQPVQAWHHVKRPLNSVEDKRPPKQKNAAGVPVAWHGRA